MPQELEVRFFFFCWQNRRWHQCRSIPLDKATDPIQPIIPQAAVAGACAAAAALRAHHRGGRIPAAAAGGVRFLEFGGEGGGDANDDDGDDIDRGWETALDTYEGADFGVQVDLAAAMS